MNCCCQDKKSEANQCCDTGIDFSLMDEIISQYRTEKGSLISVLQKVQDVYGYLPIPVLREIAVKMGLKPAQVYGTATFYTQFRLKPVGKYLILLCQGTACHVNGSERIETALAEELKIKPGETTSDGLFTLDSAACLGCCSLAPVMMINGQAYGPLTSEKASRIIRDIYTAEQQKAGEGEKA
ncbi:MAG: NADH-quinone oxidoreductase subunit NuoE [Syntrophomonadaceae bacterium]|nr:NADH-quinone oxidoreductase subunit NuoE [Syntrophomonadaceae bacterium]MDD3023852.1 NADH-quinone oxidoreductase subunit NuoE [Syntrophomonadaceae bacterium]